MRLVLPGTCTVSVFTAHVHGITIDTTVTQWTLHWQNVGRPKRRDHMMSVKHLYSNIYTTVLRGLMCDTQINISYLILRQIGSNLLQPP